MYGISLSSPQFLCQPQTVLRNKIFILKNSNPLAHVNLVSGSQEAFGTGERRLSRQLRHLSSYETPLTADMAGGEENQAQGEELFPLLRQNRKGTETCLGLSSRISLPYLSLGHHRYPCLHGLAPKEDRPFSVPPLFLLREPLMVERQPLIR